MENNDLEEISGGAAVFIQIATAVFIVPILILLAYLIFHKGIQVERTLFILAIVGVLLLGIRNTLSFADIYFSGNDIVIKKITGVTKRPIATYKTIEEGLRAGTYYIEFKDGSKVYFTLKTGELLKRITHSGTELATGLIEKFEERKTLASKI